MHQTTERKDHGPLEQNYIIVGGPSGMGKATAKLAIENDARVNIVGRSQDKLNRALDELNSPHLPASQLDMTDQDAVQDFFRTQGEESIDGLIISASTAVHGTFAETETEDVKEMFNSKFFGPYRLARQALPKMRDGAAITFFSGVLSRRPSSNAAGLAAKIRVNTVAPGMTRTDAYAGMPEAAREGMFASVAGSLPLKRVADAEDMAQAALFLTTNPFTTGHVLDVDGGHLIG